MESNQGLPTLFQPLDTYVHEPLSVYLESQVDAGTRAYILGFLQDHRVTWFLEPGDSVVLKKRARCCLI